MLIVLSPAKSLDYKTPPTTSVHTQPEFVKQAAELIELLRAFSPAEVSTLMDISDALAVLNVTRYASWSPKSTPENAKQAMLAFNGDVYEGLDAASLNAKQLDYAQSHIRILSGLYGVLRPLDIMQPYRLEMGTRLANKRGKNLYEFWDTAVTEVLNKAMTEKKSEALVNLASEEYFKVVKTKILKAPVVTPIFEEWKSGKYKIIPFYAKRARGLMARYAALHKITHVEKLKNFDMDGYSYEDGASTEAVWKFRRKTEN